MSDIGIRFDGLFLLAALAVGTVAYLLIAVVGAALALVRPQAAGRPWAVARAAALMGAAGLVTFAAVFAWWAGSGTGHVGPNWIDWMVLPVALLFGTGCWALGRVR